KLSGNQQDWGCVLPPRTDKCFQTDPDTGEFLVSSSDDPLVREDLEPVLGADDLDLFSCIATVGVNQNKCFKYEQGMAGALSAVDPGGENSEQANAFLRDDAYLVVIFVSDEDDCSADCAYEGAPWTSCKSKYCGKEEVPVSEGSSEVKTVCTGNLHEDYYETCALLPSLDETVNGQRGVLVPVSHYANQFKALKTDPSKVIVAAIAGDAVTPSSDTAPSEMLAEIMAALTPKQEGCEVRCEEGTWDASAAECVPELSDCKNGNWDASTETCIPDPSKPVDDVDFGTTSKATGTATGGCVGDVSDDDAADGKPASNCIGGECFLEDSRELREQMVATVRAVLGLEEGAFFEDTDGDGIVDETPEQVSALEDLLLNSEGEAGELSPLERAFKEVRRVAYIHSKGSPFHCYDTTYMCYSDSGKADWGSRYFELADRFGPNGVFTNLCSEQGIGPALDAIAAKIISVVNKMCLPKRPADGSTLKVVKTITNTEDPSATVVVELVEGEGPGTYTYLQAGGDDCRGPNGELLPAIIFGDEPQPGEKIEVFYEGDPLGQGL
ncbi:MAG: hypothetical protein VX938_05760, partial [Myxococcota bacterium]|nr:hypothetical protein [Myxococcota bacterium]